MTIVSEPLPILYGVKKSQMRSLFRYPGGKSWFVPYLKHWISSLNFRPNLIVEPFAGSAIIALNAVMDDMVDRAILVEKDPDISAVWNTVLNGEGEWLANRILNFELSHQNVEYELTRDPNAVHERAFVTILKNRVNRGGILAPGAGRLKEGENNKGIASRWYAQTLNRRIKDLLDYRDRITFIEGDGFRVLNQLSDQPNTVFFIDPPYPVAGERLYMHSEINHELIFQLANGLIGNFLMTYNDSNFIRDLARQYNFTVIEVHMKNTHHSKQKELLISRNLSWFTDLFKTKTETQQLSAAQ